MSKSEVWHIFLLAWHWMRDKRLPKAEIDWLFDSRQRAEYWRSIIQA